MYARSCRAAAVLAMALGMLVTDAVSVRAADEVAVEVPSDQAWTATGIAVRAGETVSIVAVGQVHFGPGPLDGVAPDGIPWGAECDEIAPRSRRNWTAPGLDCWSLLARIGSAGEPIAIGSRKTFEAPTDGPLFVGVNDNLFADNSGSWTARLTVTPAVGTAAPPGADDSGGGTPILWLLVGVAVVGAALVFFVMRRRRHAPPVVAAAGAGAATSGAVVDENDVEVNIFEVTIEAGASLRVGYNYFPEGTSVRWRVVQNGVPRAEGEFVTDGGGSEYHYETVPFTVALPTDPPVADVEFDWSVSGMPFHYSVRRETGA